MSEVDKLKRRWQKEDEGAIESAISALCQHEEGRKFLWWLLKIGNIGMQPYSGNALGTAFNCGQLDVGQQILAQLISVSPDGYISMMKENESVRRQRDDDLGKATDNDRGNYGNESLGQEAGDND